MWSLGRRALAPARIGRSFQWRAACAVGAVAALFAAGCGSGSSSSGGSGGSHPVLTFGANSAPTTLDPARDSGGGQSIRSLFNESLTHLKSDGSIGPELAASFHYVGSGNTTFEFTLRPGVHFDDGTPLTADAVKKWMTYFMHANGPFAAEIPIRSIETVGDSTVRLHLSKPSPIIPFLISDGGENWGMVCSPSAAAKPATLATRPDCIGPYVVSPSQTVTNTQYTFVPNTTYYDRSAIRFSKVVFKVINDSSTLLKAAQTGQLDVALGDVTTAPAAASSGLNIVSTPAGSTGIVFFDLAGKLAKPLADPRVRQALNYSLDRSAIAKGLLGTYGKGTSQMVTSDGFDPSYDNYYSYDPAKARALLAAAGYPNGFTLSILDASIFGVSGDPLTQAVAKYLAAVGVKVKVTTATTTGQAQREALAGTYPAYTVPLNTAPMLDQYATWLAPNAPLNEHGWVDPVLERLARAGAASANPGSYWKAMSRRIVEQGEMLTVMQQPQLFYVAKRVHGVVATLQAPVPRVVDWSIGQ